MVEVKQNGKEFEVWVGGTLLGSTKLECDAAFAVRAIQREIDEQIHQALRPIDEIDNFGG